MVGKIDEFVKANMHRLEPTALWKTAALYWKQNVVDKAALESVEIPVWNWKDLRSHYTLHHVSTDLQRMDMIRSLCAMRKTLELGLLRETEDGTRFLDPKSSELALKLMQQQSREMILMTSASMPPPPTPAGKGRGANK